MRRMLSLLLVVFGLLAAVWEPRPTAAQPARQGPVEVVGNLHASLISVMKQARELGIQGRFRALNGPVSDAFHLEQMIEAASGIHWVRASPEERQRLVQAFTRMTVAIYADRFDDYSGQQWRVVETRPGPRGTFVVQTELLRPRKKDDVRLDYVLVQRDGRWGIYDILVDGGISELATRRSEYGSILRSQGVPGLIDALNRKASEALAAAS